MLKESVSYVGLETWGIDFIICSNAQHKITIPSVHKKNPNVFKIHDFIFTFSKQSFSESLNFATVHSLMNYTNLIDSCQANLPV